MGFGSAILQFLTAGQAGRGPQKFNTVQEALAARTPGINPNASTPGMGGLPPQPTQPQQPGGQQPPEGMPDWMKLALYGAGTAANIQGARSANNAVNQNNAQTEQMRQQLLQQAENENKRREQLTRMLLPLMGRDMGYDPNRMQSRMGSGPITL